MKILCSLVLSISLSLSSFSIDFSQLSRVLYNNEELQAVYYDDILVWKAFEPFYVIENGLLVGGNYTSANRINVDTYSGYNLDYGYYGMTATDNTQTGATVKFDTRGAKTLEIVAEEYVTTSERAVSFKVTSEKGVLYTSNQTGVISVSLDISGNDTITVSYYNYGKKGQQGCRITKIYVE